jgi:hypothetical protein
MPTTWEEVLDGFERDLQAADDLSQEYAGWAPPVDLGPIPAHLEDRARTVLDRQLRALATLEPQVAAARYQVESNRRPVRPAARLAASVYLDVTA